MGVGVLGADPCGLELGALPVDRLDPVGHHMRGIDAEQRAHLVAHRARAGDDRIRGVGQPPLDRVDRGGQVGGDPSSVPAGLRGVDRGGQRCPAALAQGHGGVGHHPVVGVDDVRLPVGQQRVAVAGELALHLRDVGQQVARVVRGGVDGRRAGPGPGRSSPRAPEPVRRSSAPG